MNKTEFKAEVKKQLALRNWNYKDLERETGYTQKSIQVMMSNEEKLSENAMRSFSEALGIEASGK